MEVISYKTKSVKEMEDIHFWLESIGGVNDDMTDSPSDRDFPVIHVMLWNGVHSKTIRYRQMLKSYTIKGNAVTNLNLFKLKVLKLAKTVHG